jgi:hypothetical protein
LYNCTSNKNGDLDYGLNSSGVTYATGALFTVKNCASLGAKGTSFRTGTVKLNNSFLTSTTSTNYSSIDTTGVSGRRKADGSLPDIGYMHLAQGSALIDGGVALPTVSYYDTLGVRYYGLAPDIGCFESNYPLPVKLTSYQIQSNNKQVLNIWTTATEINTSHFNVQRSIDGVNFETVGKVMAKGSSAYSFNDILPTNYTPLKTIFYRLEIVDNDGSIEYSTIQQLSFSNKQYVTRVYPNPSNSIINIDCINANELSISDQLGRIVTQLSALVEHQKINIEKFATGTYFLKVIYKNGQTETLKLVKE